MSTKQLGKNNQSIRAISSVVSALLIITIAIVASSVAYAYITGYIGNTTYKIGQSIEISDYWADFSSSGSSYNLVLYIHNIGQGQTTLKADGSVYINGTLKRILESPAGTLLDSGTNIPISIGETKEIVVDCDYTPGAEMKIKVVTTDGTNAEITTTADNSAMLEDYLAFQPSGAIELPHGVVSEPLTIQRYGGDNQPKTDGSVTIYLYVNSGGGAFYNDTAGTHRITQITISDGSPTSGSFYFKEDQSNTSDLLTASVDLDLVDYASAHLAINVT